jgi:hypothetical protein
MFRLIAVSALLFSAVVILFTCNAPAPQRSFFQVPMVQEPQRFARADPRSMATLMLYEPPLGMREVDGEDMSIGGGPIKRIAAPAQSRFQSAIQRAAQPAGGAPSLDGAPQASTNPVLGERSTSAADRAASREGQTAQRSETSAYENFRWGNGNRLGGWQQSAPQRAVEIGGGPVKTRPNWNWAGSLAPTRNSQSETGQVAPSADSPAPEMARRPNREFSGPANREFEVYHAPSERYANQGAPVQFQATP